MANDNIQPLNPYNPFVDENKKLTRDAYNFLYNVFQRLGGSLSNLNAATLEGGTWESPGTIGSSSPNTGTFTTLNSTTLVSSGTTNLGSSSPAGVVLQGVSNGSNAASGKVGEYVTASGGSTVLTSGTTAGTASIVLTPGDWDVSGVIQYNGTSGTTIFTKVEAGISTNPAVMSSSNQTTVLSMSPYTYTLNFGLNLVTIPTRINLTTTTTVYVMARATFSGAGSADANGFIRARRVR